MKAGNRIDGLLKYPRHSIHQCDVHTCTSPSTRLTCAALQAAL